MKRFLIIFLVIIGWLTFFVRLYLRLITPDVLINESLIQYFSYFTILTNLLVTIYCTKLLLGSNENSKAWYDKDELFNALTAYIIFVGVIYTVALRHVWNPDGFTMIQSEIHHTVVPIGFLIVWFFSKQHQKASLIKTFYYLVYPVVYIGFVIIRGHFSGFYPYYFLDVSSLGMQAVMYNIAILLIVLSVFILIFHGVANRLKTA